MFNIGREWWQVPFNYGDSRYLLEFFSISKFDQGFQMSSFMFTVSDWAAVED